MGFAVLGASGYTRFVNITTAISYFLSAHTEVPVNPVCPKDSAEK